MKISKDFAIGDLVWAKMKGYPPWPAKIIQPPAAVKLPKQKKPQHYVYFFGSDNYAWILDENIIPHSERMIQSANKKKSAVFQSAIELIRNFSKNNVKKSKTFKTWSKSNNNKNLKTKTEKVEAHAIKVIPKSKSVKNVQIIKGLEGKTVKNLRNKNICKLETQKKPLKRRSLQANGISNVNVSSVAKSRDINGDNGNSYLLLNKTFHPQPSSSLCKSSCFSKSVPLISERQKCIKKSVAQLIDLETVSDYLKARHIKPTDKKIGFLGLGVIGSGIVKNLLHSGHHVLIYNRTSEKCDGFVKVGAHKCVTPADVVAGSDIIFSCVANSKAADSLIFGKFGVLFGLKKYGSNKGYVEMTAVDSDTAQNLSEVISKTGARYLEAPINGSKIQAKDGTLLILAAGDHSLFVDCETCFQAMGKNAYYINCSVGSASKFNLILNTLHGITYVALAETIALLERTELSQNHFMQILKLGTLQCPAILEKGHAMLKRSFAPNKPLKYIQKEIALFIEMADDLGHSYPITVCVNEILKHPKLTSYVNQDVSSVFHAVKY